MWAKFAVSLGVGAILLVALIIFVNHNNTDSNATLTPSEQAKVNREAELVVAADQAPHLVTLTASESPRAGFVRTVRTTMTGMVNKGVIDGPLQRAHCTRRGGAKGRPAFTCVATANDENYDFVGVVDLTAHQLTYCRREPPPVPTDKIPVSPDCTR
ncbi:MAG TPA: hypothetical protein VHV28_11955 [Solirubrobacteraceae bacterium]|jgi:phage tail sheath gpL-like|nr:hypothetical protein [Solirubrobacteraceae bacterium]